MHLASMILAPPLALDGEAATSNNAALAVLAVASMVLGYALLFALWYFVFRDKARARRKKHGPPD